MTPRALANSKGQGLIEVCLSALVLLFFLKLFFVATYSCYASLILNHHIHELAHCAGSYKAKQWLCRREFQGRLHSQLPWGKLGKVRLIPNQKSYVAKADFYVINQWKLSAESRALTRK